MAQVPMAAKVLLRPHLEDIEAKLKPGAYLLTWTSLNIDGYLHHLHMVGSLLLPVPNALTMGSHPTYVGRSAEEAHHARCCILCFQSSGQNTIIDRARSASSQSPWGSAYEGYCLVD